MNKNQKRLRLLLRKSHEASYFLAVRVPIRDYSKVAGGSNDRGMLDVVGFDTTAPSVIADFVRAA